MFNICYKNVQEQYHFLYQVYLMPLNLLRYLTVVVEFK